MLRQSLRKEKSNAFNIIVKHFADENRLFCSNQSAESNVRLGYNRSVEASLANLNNTEPQPPEEETNTKNAEIVVVRDPEAYTAHSQTSSEADEEITTEINVGTTNSPHRVGDGNGQRQSSAGEHGAMDDETVESTVLTDKTEKPSGSISGDRAGTTETPQEGKTASEESIEEINKPKKRSRCELIA